MKLSGPLHAPVNLQPETNPGTHWIEGEVGPTASMGGSGEGKMCCTWQDSKPEPSRAQLTKNVISRCQFILVFKKKKSLIKSQNYLCRLWQDNQRISVPYGKSSLTLSITIDKNLLKTFCSLITLPHKTLSSILQQLQFWLPSFSFILFVPKVVF